MTANNTNKMFGTLWVKHLATFDDLCQYKQKQVDNILNKVNRNKYWYCVCTACQTVYVVRSDYLSRKICKCQKKKT